LASRVRLSGKGGRPGSDSLTDRMISLDPKSVWRILERVKGVSFLGLTDVVKKDKWERPGKKTATTHHEGAVAWWWKVYIMLQT